MPRTRQAETRSADPNDWYRNKNNFDSTLHQIRTWLDDDPVTRGYAGMTDAEVEADFLVDTVQVPRDIVNGDELLENTDADELEELRNGVHGKEAPAYVDNKAGNWGDAVGNAVRQEKDYDAWVNHICTDVRTYERQGRIVKIMRLIWGNSSQTFADLTDYYNSLVVDRGTWLTGRIVSEEDIANARAL